MTTATATKWIRVTKRNPCPICGKPDWCLVSPDGKAAICARIESDTKAGEAGWLHNLDTAMPLSPLPKPTQDIKQTPKAAPDALDRAYLALLAELRLSETHRQNLQLRGLTDTEIDTLGYRTLPANGRRELVNRLQAKGVKLVGVPGFYLEVGSFHLSGPAGILIPIRDIKRRIVGLQVRFDKAVGGKYRWLSSRGFNAGCSPGVPVHVAGTASTNGETWITEGPIKGDIAALKLSRVVLAVAGVGNWAGVIPIVRELKPKRVIIAFDMDKLTKQAVQLHRDALMTYLMSRGIRTFEADWDSGFKGLDDLLTGGQQCQK